VLVVLYGGVSAHGVKQMSIAPGLIFCTHIHYLGRNYIRAAAHSSVLYAGVPSHTTLLISCQRARRPMLLATPLHLPSFSTQHTSEDSSQYRPSQDFKSLLPPIEFVEGSSSGGLAVPEGRYEPINATPKAPKVNVRILFQVRGRSTCSRITYRAMITPKIRVRCPFNP
jgi:hypothetical protein